MSSASNSDAAAPKPSETVQGSAAKAANSTDQEGPSKADQRKAARQKAAREERAAQAAKAPPKAQAQPKAQPKPQPKPKAQQQAKPKPKPQPKAQPPKAAVRPPVRRSFFRLRHFIVTLSFLLFVVAPSVVSGVYLWTVAFDQYASSVGFSVRREDSSSPTDVLVGLTNFSGSSSTDTDILFEYLRSQKLVSELEDEIDLTEIWSLPTDEETLWRIPSQDPVFALTPNASIEDIMVYWGRMVNVSYAAGTGLIEVEVRAFEADDATLIAERLFEKSSGMINQLSAVAREDSIRYTARELGEAEDRLRTARSTLTLFRNENQIIDPELDLQSQTSLLASLQQQKAESLIALDMLSRMASEADPRLVQERSRLEVIEERIIQERRKLGGAGSADPDDDLGGFANLIGEYETLVVDREFAQEAYISARAAHDSALSEASRQSRYLAAYLEPTRAQSAVYPERLILQVVFTLFLFLLWSLVALVYYSVKDRR
ncbi:sugar transporter [Octadecabacter sp. B2R22]|uniref:sugar transporter n=1 Tax=Octadecabacter sp. B2R22 TaxID=2841570 RepID=UPI001C0919FC|nr:sugar transporter [Octadecabacter sp. B2R22]MBU2994085.1 sugar transporter [Octadecabacter sp. B2R22]